VSSLPEQWTDAQTFTVDIEQGWDDPSFSEPPQAAKGCRLQPGQTANDLLLECPNVDGSFSEVRSGGLSAYIGREAKRLLEPTPTPSPQASSTFTNPQRDYQPDPYDQYDQDMPEPDPYDLYGPNPYDYYEPEEMYP
jgi:hypothetical protein